MKLPYQVPDGKYFVLGDHRSTSTGWDSIRRQQLCTVVFPKPNIPMFGLLRNGLILTCTEKGYGDYSVFSLKDRLCALSKEQKLVYQDLLNIGNNGIIGYIEIPSISVSLPIYHGTADSVLQVGVGHLE